MSAPILLFFLDQLRADALVHAPHIDRLAAESVRFENCITNAPLCRPARITLMTGLPVASHRFDTNRRVPAPDRVPSHVRALRDEAGYHTMVVGKTHLHDGTGHLDEHREVLRAWGFSDAIELPDAQQHWVRSAHADFLSASTAPGSVDKFRRWRDYTANHTWNTEPPDREPWSLGTDDHLDSFCARAAADAIRGYAGDRPLYLQVNFPGPHPPFDPTSEFVTNIDASAVPVPDLAPSTGPTSPTAARYRKQQRRRWTAAEIQRLRVAYFGKVALVDRGVGIVLDALRDAGLLDEAWIVLTADHGELLGERGLTGKVLCYESAIRVPLLVRPPGGVQGRVDRGTVDVLDVVATINAIAGVSTPHGTPLLDRVRTGANAHAHASVVFENMGYVGIRTARFTLAWDRALQRPVELYDRVRDPEQAHNVVEHTEYAADCNALVAELRDHSWISS